MREMKFRAWDKNKKKYLNQQNLLDDICRLHRKDGDFDDINLFRFILLIPQQDNFVLEQHTGLKDKNGKDIYEGDILSIDGWMIGSFISHGSNIELSNEQRYRFYAKVIYDDGYGSFLLEYLYRPEYSGKGSLCGIGKTGSVIGNIHENKELIDLEPNIH